jgi:Zn-dependent peptidase ImmA (M78 family)/DNA-binding XRE family transcriptional regulator
MIRIRTRRCPMSAEVIAPNLRRLRADRGVSQAVLAKAAGLSRVGYALIEAGKSEPRQGNLQAIARALDVPVRELVSPVRELQRVRFRSLKKLKSRTAVLAGVAKTIEDFGELERLLGLPSRDRLQGIDVRGTPAEAAAKVRDTFALDDSEPVRDICGLLEARGVKVIPRPVASDAFFGLSVGPEDGGPAVVVNTWDRIPVERWIFTAAHELGHLVLHRSAYDVSATEERDDEEAQANQFASHFLLPEKGFRKEWNETAGLDPIDRILKVKRIFHVSYRTILYRLSEDKPDGHRIWKAFQVAWMRRYGNTLKKADEPSGLNAAAFRAETPEPPRAREPEGLIRCDFTEDRLSLLVRRAVEAGAITLGRAAQILDLSLRDMRERAMAWAL